MSLIILTDDEVKVITKEMNDWWNNLSWGNKSNIHRTFSSLIKQAQCEHKNTHIGKDKSVYCLDCSYILGEIK